MIFSPEYLGIDLGTCNTRVYYRNGIVFNQPSLVIQERSKRKTILAVGDDAYDMLAQGTRGIEAIRPIKEGYITDFEATKTLLRYAFNAVFSGFYLFKPKVFLSYPSCISNIDKRALEEATEAAISKKVKLIEKPLLAAYGCGLPISENKGQMIVDIGGGTTDIAVLSSSGIVVRHSVRVGGNLMDESIIRYIKQQHQILISAKKAEAVKKDLGSAVEQTNVRYMPVLGIDVNSGIGQDTRISTTEVYAAIKAPCMAIVEAIKWVLEHTPPDLIVDIIEAGVTLTGGCAALYEMAGFISEQLGIEVHKADKNMDSAINGLGFIIENQDALAKEGLEELVL